MSHTKRMMDRRRWLTHGACLVGGAAAGWLGCRYLPLAAPEAAVASAEGGEETPEGRLKKLGLVLPKPNAPKGAVLVPAVRTGELLFVSGHTPPPLLGKPLVGKVGKDFTVKDAQAAARSIGLLILAVVRAELGSLDRVVRLVKVLGMVNSTPDFTQQPLVINGFSSLMVDVFGEKAGKGARSAVGMASLPGGVPVEIEAIFQVKA